MERNCGRGAMKIGPDRSKETIACANGGMIK